MISHARARYGAVSPSGARAGAGGWTASSHQPQMPTHKAQRRGACLVPLQPQAQAPARTATAGRAGGGIDVLGRVAGRPPLISRALHALSRRSRRRGCVVVIDLDPTLWPARFACYAAVSSVRPGHERRPTGQRPVAVPMPTSHPYKGSEAGAARVRTYMVLRCAPGLPSWSMFRRGSFSHMCLPFQFSISMCGALFPSC